MVACGVKYIITSWKVSAGLYTQRSPSGSQLIIGTHDGYHASNQSRDLPTYADFLETIKNLDLNVEHVDFLRINTEWFDLSFEDESYVLGTKGRYAQEISWFLQETAPVRYRAAAFRREVESLLALDVK